MSVFYLGAHQPFWLWQAPFPLFVSHRQLARRRTLRPALCRWGLDRAGSNCPSMAGGSHPLKITPPQWLGTPTRSGTWTSPRRKTGCANRSCWPAPA